MDLVLGISLLLKRRFQREKIVSSHFKCWENNDNKQDYANTSDPMCEATPEKN